MTLLLLLYVNALVLLAEFFAVGSNIVCATLFFNNTLFVKQTLCFDTTVKIYGHVFSVFFSVVSINNVGGLAL